MERIETGGVPFLCDTEIEARRAQTLLTKEPGTIHWLDTMGPADVLFDIGANIGCYTLYAAHRLSQGDAIGTGHVFAFEPHLVNAAHLLRNIGHAGLSARATVLTCALGATSGLRTFYYRALAAGASGSQLDEPLGENGESFAPEAWELKTVIAVDDFLPHALPYSPTHIKIDVDGHELDILRGMPKTLRSDTLRTLQIESHPHDRASIEAVMADASFRLERYHDTKGGEKRIRHGAEPTATVRNAVFVRAA